MRAPKEGTCDPIAPLELPHAMHAFNRVSATDKLNMVSFFFFLFPFHLLMPMHNYLLCSGTYCCCTLVKLSEAIYSLMKLC